MPSKAEQGEDNPIAERQSAGVRVTGRHGDQQPWDLGACEERVVSR